jgi:methyl-accepting chemotaxis protein
MLNKFKLRTLILLGYTPAIIVLLILGGSIYATSLHKQQLREEVKQQRLTELSLVSSTFRLSGMLRTMRGALLFPDEKYFWDTYAEEVKGFQENSTKLSTFTQNTEQQELMAAYLTEANRLLQETQQVLQALRTGNSQQAMQLSRNVRFEGVEVAFANFNKQLQSEVNATSAKEDAATNFLSLVITLGTLMSILVTLVAGAMISAKISQSIQGATTEIATASSEIATTMEEQERVASAQAASVNETTTTMDELEASCRQSAEQAQAAVAAAKQALALATSGTQAVKETMEGMFVMEKKVESIAEQIIRLSEQANQIAGISSLVSELANQTNMIALNSSVEAVRAGEAGKGFAVVANEIRKLSDHSQQSADKINALVSEIQKAVNSTVMVIDEGTKIVKGNVQVTQRMDESFSGVAESVNKVVLSNQQVSLNLKQQVDAIQEVVKAMDTINKGAREAAAGLVQTKKGTMGLNEAASMLRNLI